MTHCTEIESVAKWRAVCSCGWTYTAEMLNKVERAARMHEKENEK